MREKERARTAAKENRNSSSNPQLQGAEQEQREEGSGSPTLQNTRTERNAVEHKDRDKSQTWRAHGSCCSLTKSAAPVHAGQLGGQHGCRESVGGCTTLFLSASDPNEDSMRPTGELRAKKRNRRTPNPMEIELKQNELKPNFAQVIYKKLASYS